jgi:hypothetical protein
MRLLQVDNMNTVTLGEDVRFHTGVPLVGAMSKVNAALKQGLHGYDGHCFSYFIPFSKAQSHAGAERSEFSGDRNPLRDALCPSRAGYCSFSERRDYTIGYSGICKKLPEKIGEFFLYGHCLAI